MWKAFWRVRAPQRGCSPQFIKTWSCEAPGTRQLQKGVLLGMVDFSGLDAFPIATSQKSSWMSCEWRFLTFMPWLQHFSAVWNGEGRRVATGGGAISKQIPWVCHLHPRRIRRTGVPIDCRKYLGICRSPCPRIWAFLERVLGENEACRFFYKCFESTTFSKCCVLCKANICTWNSKTSRF